MRVLPAIFACAVGCSAARSPAPPTSAVPAAPPGTAPPAALARPRASGLEDATNDAAIVSAAREVLACGPRADDAEACPAAAAWMNVRGVFDAAGEATLLNMVEDPDASVRELAASALAVNAYRPLPDALAKRLLAAAERETSAPAALQMFSALGRVDVEATGTFDRVRALVSRDASAKARGAFVSSALGVNGGSRRMFELVVPFVTDPDPHIRYAALKAFMIRPWRFPDETCALLVGVVRNGAVFDSAEAARLVARSAACRDHYDGLLGVVESRAATGKAIYNDYVALSWLCQDPAATERQRRRGEAVAARRAAQTRGESFERITALTALFVCSGASGKDRLLPFVADPNPDVREKAVGLRKFGLLRGCDE